MDLQIKGFIETSFLDWDSKIVSVVFVPFCNFKCPFCHNSELILNPQGFNSVEFNKIEKFLNEHHDFIDGICLTGGEPCMHAESGLFDFIKHVRKMGLLVKLDTNGAFPEILRRLIGEKLIDYIAMDIKGPLDKRYDKAAGVKVDIGKIKESIDIIMHSGVEYEFRTTVVPGIHTEDDIVDIAKSISGAAKLVLQQFVPKNTWDSALQSVKPYDIDVFDRTVKSIRPFVKHVCLRGV